MDAGSDAGANLAAFGDLAAAQRALLVSSQKPAKANVASCRPLRGFWRGFVTPERNTCDKLAGRSGGQASSIGQCPHLATIPVPRAGPAPFWPLAQPGVLPASLPSLLSWERSQHSILLPSGDTAKNLLASGVVWLASNVERQQPEKKEMKGSKDEKGGGWRGSRGWWQLIHLLALCTHAGDLVACPSDVP